MKKQLFILFLALIMGVNGAFAASNSAAQTRINNCGQKILKANRLEHPVTYLYGDSENKPKLAATKALLARRVELYSDDYSKIEDDDELAAYLARGTALVVRTYDGIFSGKLRTLQIKAAPKKYEIVADKIAVDYMVKAGYDPIALIVLIKKIDPDKKYSAISTKNSTSKRLAIIYEYIYTKYPYYLVNNKYFENQYYQSFLAGSESNRKLLEKKIKSHSRKELNYE